MRGNAHAYPTQLGRKATTVAASQSTGSGARYPHATSISAGGKGPASFFAIALFAPSAPTNQSVKNSAPVCARTIQPSSGSEPGADRGPRAGSPRGVVDATGSRVTSGRSAGLLPITRLNPRPE